MEIYKTRNKFLDGHQSAILDPIRPKLFTLIHSMIVYKFPIHYVYKLWSWVTQIMKFLIFSNSAMKDGRQSAILDPIQILHTEYIMKIPKNSAETNAQATFRRFR